MKILFYIQCAVYSIRNFYASRPRNNGTQACSSADKSGNDPDAMKRLRILMLIPELGFGGAEGAFLRLASYLKGHAEVRIALAAKASGSTTPSPVCVWTDLPITTLDGEGSTKPRRWWRMLRHVRSLKHEHDVTISFLSGMNVLNALAGPRNRTIVSERGSKRYNSGQSYWQRVIWTRIIDPLTYWRAGRIVAASEGLAHEIITANPWTAKHVVAIEGTVRGQKLVDAAHLPVEPELQALADYETVVAFGRLHVQKGYDALLAAFAQVRARRPAARLLLIGEGPQEAHLRELAAHLGLHVEASGTDADVILPGKRSDPIRYLRLGRVFAFPSRFEGLPNALIEALAAGVPVLASDCCWGPRSILSAGTLNYTITCIKPPLKLELGTLMPMPDSRENIKTWAQEIERALTVPHQHISSELLLSVVARYDIERTGPVWLRLVEEMARDAERCRRRTGPRSGYWTARSR